MRAHPDAGRPPTTGADAPEPVLLIIADMSGYTRYMTANAKTLAHSQTIITELVKAIITQIELPLAVAKLEGDAVFLYCRKSADADSWRETRRVIGGKLLAFFRMFSERVRELSQSTACTCNACTHIERLRLKIIVHSGEALFHHVFNFLELAGVDVIIVHRLLKNSINVDQYLLLTEAARRDVEFPETIHLAASSETYADLGRVNTLVYLPDADADNLSPQTPILAPQESERRVLSRREPEPPQPQAEAVLGAPFRRRFGRSWKFTFRLWFGPLAPKSRARRQTFHHVTVSTGRGSRIGFALLTLLLTPIYLPVGTVFVFFHALRAPGTRRPHEGQHEHKADGSCCHQ